MEKFVAERAFLLNFAGGPLRLQFAVFCLTGFFIVASCAAAVVINEASPINHSIIQDENGEYPDWIELYNSGPEPADLQGFGLSDNPASPFKFVFPSMVMQPGEFLLVFASGETRRKEMMPPDEIDGLALWLRADSISDGPLLQSGEGVALWRDQSGHGHHAIQTAKDRQPLFQNAGEDSPGFLSFDGRQQFLTIPFSESLNPEQMTLFVVARTRASAGAAPLLSSKPVENQGYIFYFDQGDRWNFWLGSGDHWRRIYDSISKTPPYWAAINNSWAQWFLVREDEPLPAGQMQIYCIQIGEFETKAHRKGGLAMVEPSLLDPNKSAPLSIGRTSQQGVSSYFSGDVAEIILFNRVLDEDERRRIEGYLGSKHGVGLAHHFHAGFKLSSEGEPVILTAPSGTTVSQLPPWRIPPDHSWGRTPDAGAEVRLFPNPTPGEANNSAGATLEMTEAPQFSMPGGFYPAAIPVTLTAAPGAKIYYTMDGSEPGPGSWSPIYAGPIVPAPPPVQFSQIPTSVLNFYPPSEPVFKGTVVRARAFLEGHAPSPIATHTYFFHPNAGERYSLAVVSLGTDPANFFDDQSGIYVPGVHPDGSPITGDPPHFGANFHQRGPEWEKPVSIEFFEADGTREFQADAGIEIFGNYSRALPQKSLQVKFRSRYGDNPLRYPVFHGNPVQEFRDLILRNSGQDWWRTMMRDALIHSLGKETRLYVQDYRPVIVFLNGEYWGIHNLRERQDQHYLSARDGLEPEQFELLRGHGGVMDGAPNHFVRMIQFITREGVSDAANYSHVKTQMDVDSFIQFKAAQTYFVNQDALGNSRFWRSKTPESKWQWMLFDTDVGFDGYAYEVLALFTETDDLRTFLLRSLLENAEFKAELLSRFADDLNSIFRPDRVISMIDEMAGVIAGEIPEHINRWPYIGPIHVNGRRVGRPEHWAVEIEDLRIFARERPSYLRKELINYFNLSGTAGVSLRVSEGGSVRINSLQVTSEDGDWSGVYFQGIPVRLMAVAKPGYRFAGWTGGLSNSSALLEMTPSEDLLLEASFEKMNLDEAVLYPAPFALASASYRWGSWSPSNPSGTYPPHMAFQQTSIRDPGLSIAMEGPWNHPYNLENRSRIIGRGAEGISFLNTGNAQDDSSGYLGAAVLALNTEGVSEVWVSWTSGTVQPNSRPYALRLQYRTAQTEDFQDVMFPDGASAEYRSHSEEGHTEVFGPLLLPERIAGKPLVELRWKYYSLTQQGSGPRAELRLDDIVVSSKPMKFPGPAQIKVEGMQSDGPFTLRLWMVEPSWIHLESSSDLKAWNVSHVLQAFPGMARFEIQPNPAVPYTYFRAQIKVLE